MKDHGTVLLIDDPPAKSSGIARQYAVSGCSPEELAHAVFATLADDIGDKRAREVLTALLKRPKGRPSWNAANGDARWLPGILLWEGRMPGASTHAVVTAFVKDVSARGYLPHLGASEHTAIVRLTRYRDRLLAAGVSRRVANNI